jgi:hypothetical protein
MYEVKIDGVLETVQPCSNRGGWYTYNIIRDGKPVSEISVPVELSKPFIAFRTSGHKFERAT